jgi:ABC-type Zn2+ transport system substrate-binding protein/surface adhesin
MAKKKKYEEDDEEIEDEDEEEDEDEDDEEKDEDDEEEKEEKEKKQRGRPKIKETSNWQLQHIPEVFRVINPKTKTIIVEALSLEELRVQLAVITAQHSIEAAKNTR